MLLIISNTSDETANFLQKKITDKNKVFRLNTDEFPLFFTFSSCINNRNRNMSFLSKNEQKICLSDISSIWWRRPQDYGKVVIEQINDSRIKNFTSKQIVDCFNSLTTLIPKTNRWVNYPDNNRKAENKILQLEIARDVGFLIPDTIYSNDPEVVKNFFNNHKGKVVCKATSRPSFDVDGKIFGFYTSKVSEDQINNQESIRASPLLMQNLIKKKFEVRVTVIGENIFSAKINSQDSNRGTLDWRKIPIEKQGWESFDLDSETKEKCFKIVKYLGLNFGAIDLAVTPDDNLVFFEINPNGQWAWLELVLGLPMSKAFIQLFFD